MGNYLYYFSYIHSILRYLVLIFTFMVALQSLMGLLGKKEFTNGNRKTALFMMICCDIQLLVGLGVYYLSGQMLVLKEGGSFMKDGYKRFYAMEHPLGMLIAIILVHLAYAVVKKTMNSEKKFKRLFWYSFIALFIFVAQTPWPSKKVTSKPWLPGQTMPA